MISWLVNGVERGLPSPSVGESTDQNFLNFMDLGHFGRKRIGYVFERVGAVFPPYGPITPAVY